MNLEIFTGESSVEVAKQRLSSPEQVESSVIERLLEFITAEENAFSAEVIDLATKIRDVLYSPEMRPHLLGAAERLQTELAAIVEEENNDTTAIREVLAALHEETLERPKVATQELLARDVRQAVVQDIEQRSTLVAVQKERIQKSLDQLLAGLQISFDTEIQFLDAGAQKDVFLVQQGENRQAVSVIHATAEVPLSDVEREVAMTQTAQTDGILAYTDLRYMDAGGDMQNTPDRAAYAIVESEYVNGNHAEGLAQSFYQAAQQKEYAQLAKEEYLAAYRKEIDKEYASIEASLLEQHAIVLEENILDALIDRYAIPLAEQHGVGAEQYRAWFRKNLTGTLDKQTRLVGNSREEAVGKQLLVNTIAAARLESDATMRADRLRIKDFASRVLAQFARPAQAIDTLHASGMVHQDIKPENIIGCTLDTAADTATVIDFGSATYVGQTERISAGTKRYMEPELFGRTTGKMAEKGSQPRRDVRAFAITLFDVFTDSFQMERLTVFPPVEQNGTVVHGSTVVESGGPFVRFFEGDMEQKYQWLKGQLKTRLELPDELLTMFDSPAGVTASGVDHVVSCVDMFTAMQTWVQSLDGAALGQIRSTLQELSDAAAYMDQYIKDSQ